MRVRVKTSVRLLLQLSTSFVIAVCQDSNVLRLHAEGPSINNHIIIEVSGMIIDPCVVGNI